MQVLTNTPRVVTPTRLAVAALGMTVVSGLAAAAAPASASRPEPAGSVSASTASHTIDPDSGEMLAQRKGTIDARWWVLLGNAG